MTKREPEMEAAEKAWEESITPGKIICTDDTSSHGLIKAGFIVGYAAGRASREGLREALEEIAKSPGDNVWISIDVAQKALEADGKVG